jgi:hypothetical protein
MEFYKKDIIDNYPESRYAKLLANPELSKELDKQSPEYLYASTYKLLETQNYQEIIAKSDTYSTFFGEDDIAPKFQLLKATALGRLKGYDTYIKTLNEIAVDYANTPEGEKAKSLALSLKSVKDTSFVDGKTSTSFKAIYRFNSEEFNQINAFKEALQKAILKISFYDLSISEDVYDETTKFVVVHGITSQQGASSFNLLLKDNNSRNQEDRKAFKINRTAIGISTKNYQTIQIHKNLNSYIDLKQKDHEAR